MDQLQQPTGSTLFQMYWKKKKMVSINFSWNSGLGIIHGDKRPGQLVPKTECSLTERPLTHKSHSGHFSQRNIYIWAISPSR